MAQPAALPYRRYAWWAAAGAVALLAAAAAIAPASDVLAGWAVGASWALVCWCVTIWLQDHGVIEQDLAHPIEVRRAQWGRD